MKAPGTARARCKKKNAMYASTRCRVKIERVQNARAPPWPQGVESQRKNASRRGPTAKEEERERGKAAARCLHTAAGAGRVQKRDLQIGRERSRERNRLSCLENDYLCTQSHEMLREHSTLWNGVLGALGATEHRIPLAEGTKQTRSTPYRQRLTRREIVAKEVKRMLNAGVIDPSGTG